jgi:uncharacterized protein YciI
LNIKLWYVPNYSEHVNLRLTRITLGANIETTMQQFLYRIQPVRLGMLTEGPTDREAAIVGDHFRYLQRLVAEGTVLMAGRTLNADDRTFGIVVFVAASEARASEIVSGDPAVMHGVMRAELFPYRVALWSNKSRIDDAHGV